MKTILVAVDGSESAMRAVESGAKLALGADTTLLLMTVLPLPDAAPDGEPADTDEDRPAGEEWALPPRTQEAKPPRLPRHLEEAGERARKAGVTHLETITVAGDIVDEILTLSEEYETSLIVMGRRGLGTVASVLLGSVSAQVVRRAQCPVMIVP